MSNPTRATIAALVLCLPVFGQVACDDSLDYRPSEKACMAIVGTAHFQVSRMRIVHQLQTQSSYDDFSASALKCMVDTFTSSQPSIDGSAGGEWGQVQSFIQDLTGDTGWAATAQAFMIGTAFGGLVEILQSNNIGFRNYTFIAPVAGTYRIEARLAGGIDKPRNRVLLAGPNGTSQIDDDNPSGDRTKVYYLSLPMGAYNLTMALGKGSSATFHNAGTLTSVLLDHPTPLVWDSPVVVATKQIPLVTNMPYEGARATSQLSYRVPTAIDFPNILSGNVQVDQFRPMDRCYQARFVLTWRADAPYTLCVTEAPLSFYQMPVLNPTTCTATYYFQRGVDATRQVYVRGPLPQKTLD